MEHPAALLTRYRRLSAGALSAALVLAFGEGQAVACPHKPGSRWDQPMSYSVKNEGGMTVLSAQGRIELGEGQRLEWELRKAGRIDEVWMSSPGGDAVEGLAMGRVLRMRGMAVRIPKGASCFSACSYAFVGGVIRSIDSDGCYGVHMFTAARDETASDVVESIIKRHGKDETKVVYRRLVEKIQEWEQQSAQFAQLLAQYLIEMSVSLELMIPNFETKATKDHWLNRQELRRYNVVNSR